MPLLRQADAASHSGQIGPRSRLRFRSLVRRGLCSAATRRGVIGHRTPHTVGSSPPVIGRVGAKIVVLTFGLAALGASMLAFGVLFITDSVRALRLGALSGLWLRILGVTLIVGAIAAFAAEVAVYARVKSRLAG